MDEVLLGNHAVFGVDARLAEGQPAWQEGVVLWLNGNAFGRGARGLAFSLLKGLEWAVDPLKWRIDPETNSKLFDLEINQAWAEFEQRHTMQRISPLGPEDEYRMYICNNGRDLRFIGKYKSQANPEQAIIPLGEVKAIVGQLRNIVDEHQKNLNLKNK
jgi:hypothetical protein